MNASFYDSDAALEQYLLFHYGTPDQICPLLPEAHSACGFPVRCVTEPLRFLHPVRRNRALDLGCAVGRSALELGRTFEEVIGIDFSERFIAAAHQIKTAREAMVRIPREGAAHDELCLRLPHDLETGRVHFEVGDACLLRENLDSFDLILMANLIDRLPDPARCLAQLGNLLTPGGMLIITSPYTWLEEYTPREKWLDGGGRGTLAVLQEILSSAFVFQQAINLPFLIREHRRKYQWSIAEASFWLRR